jgi:hypothetical protein
MGSQAPPVLTWWDLLHSGAEGRDRVHLLPPTLRPGSATAPAPAPLPLSPAAPPRLEPPARLLTSRRGRFHPRRSLCDVTMTTDRGRERPGTGSGGGRREGRRAGAPARRRGRVRVRGGGALTSRRLNLLLWRLRRSPRAGRRGAGRASAAMLVRALGGGGACCSCAPRAPSPPFPSPLRAGSPLPAPETGRPHRPRAPPTRPPVRPRAGPGRPAPARPEPGVCPLQAARARALGPDPGPALRGPSAPSSPAAGPSTSGTRAQLPQR